ncbi:site-2 protease family protein [bacterium]|nr:site-2 protease family protein [bacterium]
MEKLLQPDFIIFFIGFLVSLSFHEASHAYTAHILGDDTPKRMGRLTLNPIKHWDPIGSIALPLAGYLGFTGGFVIGWGKPVTVNYSQFRHVKRDAMLVAFAGPFSNFVLAFLLALLFKMGLFNGNAAQKLVLLNLSLAFFNLLPLYPLDGEKVLTGLLPRSVTALWAKIRPYSMMIAIILLMSGALTYLVFIPALFIARFMLNF